MGIPLWTPASVVDLGLLGPALPSLVSVSRASNAMQFGSNGALTYAPNNAVIYSEDFAGNWTAFLSSVAGGAGVGPLGIGTASDVTFTAQSTAQIYSNNLSITASTYTFSVWAKTISGTKKFRLKLYNGSTDQFSSELTATTTWTRFSAQMPGLTTSNANVGIANDIGASAGDLIIWGAQLEIGSVVNAYSPTGGSPYYAPRFDYDPTTLAPNGLLIEQQISEKIVNSALTGAVPGTPGTLPSGVTNNLSGLSQQIVGTGTEDGIPYIDIRFFGTTSGTTFGLGFGAITDAAASNGQTWTGSIFHRLVGGSLANITGEYLFQFEYNNVPAFLNAPSVACATPTSAPLRTQRQVATITHSQAGLAYLLSLYYFTCGNGVAIDITIRVGAPGLAQVSGIYDPILTYGAQLTKAVDQLSIDLTKTPWWQSPAGCWCYVEFDNAVPAAVSGVNIMLEAVLDGNNFNHIVQSGGVAYLYKSVGGSVDGPYGLGVVQLGRNKMAWSDNGNGVLIGAMNGTTASAFKAGNPVFTTFSPFIAAGNPGRMRSVRMGAGARTVAALASMTT